MNIDDLAMDGGDDEDKLVANSSRSSDEQVFWLGLGVALLLGLLMLGASQCGSVGSDLADSFSLGSDEDAILVVNGVLDDEADLRTSAAFFGDGDFDRDLGDERAGPF